MLTFNNTIHRDVRQLRPQLGKVIIVRGGYFTQRENWVGASPDSVTVVLLFLVECVSTRSGHTHTTMWRRLESNVKFRARVLREGQTQLGNVRSGNHLKLEPRLKFTLTSPSKTALSRPTVRNQ
jgi:hypothetical protein